MNSIQQNRKKFIAILLFLLLDAVGIIYIVIEKKPGVYVADPVQHEAVQAPRNSTSTPVVAQIINAVEVKEETVSPVMESNYIQITDGCAPYYQDGECVNIRSGPGVEYPVVRRLRTGVVLGIESNSTSTPDGHEWHKVRLDKYLRYPERVTEEWYVAVDSEYIDLFYSEGPLDWDGVATTTKHVVIDISDQKLYAYDGEELFLEETISSGLLGSPTPIGTFNVYRKTPSRYMQGPLPGISEDYYDLPGVPWNLYFTYEGAVIHGAYWHDRFGERWSHGCANLPVDIARKLYEWADIGMQVKVVY